MTQIMTHYTYQTTLWDLIEPILTIDRSMNSDNEKLIMQNAYCVFISNVSDYIEDSSTERLSDIVDIALKNECGVNIKFRTNPEIKSKFNEYASKYKPFFKEENK